MNKLSLIGLWQVLAVLSATLIPSLSYGAELGQTVQDDLKTHLVGYFTIAVTVGAYIVAMTEDMHRMSKAKPMVLGCGLIWFSIFIYQYCGNSGFENIPVRRPENRTGQAPRVRRQQ